MLEITKMTIYMVVYRCVKLDRIIDEYPVGYFVSKEEALSSVLDDIERCENVDFKVETYTITGFDKDPEYKHIYRLNKINVGADFPHENLSEITSWE